MQVVDIIKAVRWCIDEEAVNTTNLDGASAYDFGGAHTDIGLMNNIIKSKIGDALRWVCLYAPTDLLGGSDEKTSDDPPVEIPTGVLVDVDSATVTPIPGQTAGSITLASDFIKLARVRVSGWHRAIKDPIGEDSEEYLQLYDANGATATADRPQAALIERSTRKLEVWPWASTNTVSLTYVSACEPKGLDNQGQETSGDSITRYAFPQRAKTAIIYYLAFLVLSAYEDSRAARMLEIAKMNLGRNG